MKYILSLILLSLCFGIASAQQPNITNIDPGNGYPEQTINIAGSGFGSTIGNIKVWFGGVEGNVVSVTDNLIQVTAPSNAPHGNVTVLNTSSGLLDTSNEQFFISHAGTTFNNSQLSAPQEYFLGTAEMFDLCSCDLDNDGLVDMATTVTVNGTEIRLLKNTSTIGTLSFTELTSTDFPVLDTGFPLRNIGCSDLNGDGNIDLYVSRNGQEKIFIYENTNTVAGTMSFTAAPIEVNLVPFTAGDPFQPRRIAAKDLTGDGKPELVITNDKEGSFNVLINESTTGIAFNGTQEVFNITEMTNTSGIAIQDMDNDGRADLVLTRRFASDVYVLKNIGAGSDINFEDPFILSTNGSPSVNAITADFNNDGLQDILAVHVTNNVAFVYENTSTGGALAFADPVTITTGQESWNASAGDLNGDGLLDVVVTSRAETSYAVAINDGAFSFTSSIQSIARNSRNVNLQDYDGDGKVDISLTTFNSTGDDALMVIRNSNCHDPIIQNETPLAICTGQTIRLNAAAAPGATFNWSKDAASVKSGPENFLDITTFGNYELEVVSEGGACTNTTSINVTDGAGSPPADPVASNNGPSCIGGDITLSSTTISGATYSWTGPNGFTSSDQNPAITGITTDNAGVYSVQVTVGDCQSATDNTTVVVNEPPVFSASTSDPTTVCSGTSVTVTTQNQAGFTYQWLESGTDISGATSSSFNATATGTYSVRVSETSSNCEVVTNEIDVQVYAQPVSSFTIDGNLCAGSDLTFTSTSTLDTNATAVYDWSFSDGGANGTAATEIRNFAAGDYTVTLDVSYSTGAGCNTSSSSQSITVVDPQAISINASQSFICNGESVDLSVDNSFTNINWSTSETTATITVSVAATYSVTAEDANGCTVSDSFDLMAGSAPTIDITVDGNPGDATVSAGGSVQLEATGADSYLWQPGRFLSDSTIANPIATPEATITYTVFGSVAGSCDGQAQVTLTLAPEGEININPLKAFSPNSTIDPTWRVDGVENYPDCTMSIFDERGTLIYRQTGYANDWDATYEGNPLPEGVYYFIFSCEDIEPESGSILVVR
ncbi:MAG: FG-GAP-like repeat-containing protein [Fulvivirga sp.]